LVLGTPSGALSFIPSAGGANENSPARSEASAGKTEDREKSRQGRLIILQMVSRAASISLSIAARGAHLGVVHPLVFDVSNCFFRAIEKDREPTANAFMPLSQRRNERAG